MQKLLRNKNESCSRATGRVQDSERKLNERRTLNRKIKSAAVQLANKIRLKGGQCPETLKIHQSDLGQETTVSNSEPILVKIQIKKTPLAQQVVNKVPYQQKWWQVSQSQSTYWKDSEDDDLPVSEECNKLECSLTNDNSSTTDTIKSETTVENKFQVAINSDFIESTQQDSTKFNDICSSNEDSLFHGSIRNESDEDDLPLIDLINKNVSHNLENQIEPRRGQPGYIALRLRSSFTCDTCGKVLKNYKSMNRHKMAHLGKKQFACNICNIMFVLKKHLENHLKIHLSKEERQYLRMSNRPSYKCQLCSKVFHQRTLLEGHLRKHSGQCPFLCNLCGKSFTTEALLKQHMKHHSEERPFECSKCHKAYKFKKEWRLHVLSHEPEKQFHCKYCCKPFRTYSHKIRHQHVIHEGKKGRGRPCEICGKQYYNNVTFNAHMNRHLGIRAYFCAICGKGFFSQNNLYVHEKTHNPNKRVSCDICDKSFTTKWSLKTHMNRHLNASPFVCNICGKGFSANNFLMTHNRFHTGELPYSCDTCGRCFRTASNLNNHQNRVHLHCRKHKCTFCFKTFISSTQLNNHIRTHTGEKPFQCHICLTVFSQKANMQQHVLKVHQIDNKPASTEIIDAFAI